MIRALLMRLLDTALVVCGYCFRAEGSMANFSSSGTMWFPLLESLSDSLCLRSFYFLISLAANRRSSLVVGHISEFNIPINYTLLRS